MHADMLTLEQSDRVQHGREWQRGARGASPRGLGQRLERGEQDVLLLHQMQFQERGQAVELLDDVRRRRAGVGEASQLLSDAPHVPPKLPMPAPDGVGAQLVEACRGTLVR